MPGLQAGVGVNDRPLHGSSTCESTSRRSCRLPCYALATHSCLGAGAGLGSVRSLRHNAKLQCRKASVRTSFALWLREPLSSEWRTKGWPHRDMARLQAWWGTGRHFGTFIYMDKSATSVSTTQRQAGRPVPSPCMGLVLRSGSQYGINLKYGFRSFKGKILSAPPQMPFCYGMSLMAAHVELESACGMLA